MKIDLLACAVSIALALPLAAQHSEPSLTPPANQITEGKRIFEMNCSVGYCHGLEGRAGKGPRLRDRVWSRSYLDSTVEKGIPNSSMPAWQGRLTKESIDAVVAYVLSISHEQSSSGVTDDKRSAAMPQPISGKSATLGKQLFFDSQKDRNCGTCHRIAGSGTPIAPDLPVLAKRSDEMLLRQMLEPPTSAALLRVTLKNGDTVCGTRVGETKHALQIYDLVGHGPPVLRTIDQNSIIAAGPCPDFNVHSINAQNFTIPELMEIVAYLKSVR